MQIPETKEASMIQEKVCKSKRTKLYERKTKCFVIEDANDIGTICADAGIPFRISRDNVV